MTNKGNFDEEKMTAAIQQQPKRQEPLER